MELQTSLVRTKCFLRNFSDWTYLSLRFAQLRPPLKSNSRPIERFQTRPGFRTLGRIGAIFSSGYKSYYLPKLICYFYQNAACRWKCRNVYLVSFYAWRRHLGFFYEGRWETALHTRMWRHRWSLGKSALYDVRTWTICRHTYVRTHEQRYFFLWYYLNTKATHLSFILDIANSLLCWIGHTWKGTLFSSRSSDFLAQSSEGGSSRGLVCDFCLNRKI